MGKRTYETLNMSVADAVSAGVSALIELGDEAREIVENASDGLRETQRIQTFEETADTLENLDEPNTPDYTLEDSFEVRHVKPRGRSKPLSRADRRDNAVATLRAAVDHIQGVIDNLEELRGALEQAADDADSCDFPGMYG